MAERMAAEYINRITVEFKYKTGLSASELAEDINRITVEFK